MEPAKYDFTEMDDRSSGAGLAMATRNDDDSQRHSTQRNVQISIQSLSTEIILNIFRFLIKRDLKAVRLVQQAWTNLPAAALFDQVYISPHTKDLDVLAKISCHPVYSTKVKKAIYLTDLWKKKISDLTYIEHLVVQIMYPFNWRFGSSFEGEELLYADEEIMRIIRCGMAIAEYGFLDIKPRLMELKDLRIIKEGLAAYRHRAAEIYDSYLQPDRTVKRISAAIKLFHNLNTVEFDHFVPSYGFPREVQDTKAWEVYRMSGSPTVRSWHLFYLQPRKYRVDVHAAFFTMIDALALGSQKLRSLIARKMAPYLFNLSSRADYPFDLRHRIDALRHLEVFRLQLRPRKWEEPDMLQNLPLLLRSMTPLRELELDLGDIRWLAEEDRLPLHSIHEVFGGTVNNFPKLERLTLRWLRCTVKELIEFLSHCNRLTSLEMEGIELMEGRWVDVTDFLITTLHLPRVVFVGRMRQPGNIGVRIASVGEGYDRLFKVEEHTCTTFDDNDNDDDNNSNNFIDRDSDRDEDSDGDSYDDDNNHNHNVD